MRTTRTWQLMVVLVLVKHLSHSLMLLERFWMRELPTNMVKHIKKEKVVDLFINYARANKRPFTNRQEAVLEVDQILENVWPNNINVESRTIDVHIRRLRQAINLDGKKELIRTVRSSGYSLI